MFSSCTRTHRANTYTRPVCALSRIRSRVRVRNQFPLSPFFPPSLPLLLHDLCLFRSLVADTRPTCKSCRDLVYLRDSRFPTTGVFPPTKLDRPLSGRFFSSVFLFSFSFSSLSLAAYSFGLLVWGEKLIGRSIIVSFLRRYGNGLKKELRALLTQPILSSRETPFCSNSLRDTFKIKKIKRVRDYIRIYIV